MANEHVIVIEDDPDITELVTYNLEQDGYRLTAFDRGVPGMRAMSKAPPDLVLLDIMLPGMDGLDLCKQMKTDERLAEVPIIMMSARGEESDVIIGLELGADDYITKPFSPGILLARLKAVLRRHRRRPADDDAVLRRGPLVIDRARHRVSINGQPLALTPTVFGLLHLLARKPGWVMTRQQIVDGVKGKDYAVTERSVDVQVVGLRRKLGAHAGMIETVRGIGYRFAEEDEG